MGGRFNTLFTDIYRGGQTYERCEQLDCGVNKYLGFSQPTLQSAFFRRFAEIFQVYFGFGDPLVDIRSFYLRTFNSRTRPYLSNMRFLLSINFKYFLPKKIHMFSSVE